MIKFLFIDFKLFDMLIIMGKKYINIIIIILGKVLKLNYIINSGVNVIIGIVCDIINKG